MSRLSNLTLCHAARANETRIARTDKTYASGFNKTRVAYSNETRVILTEAQDLNRSVFATTNASSPFPVRMPA
jgi:hypothetical protein